MTKSDLRARPVFHRLRDSHRSPPDRRVRRARRPPALQDRTGVSINKIVKTLRPLRTVHINLGGQQITAAPRIPAQARALLDRLPTLAAPGH